MKKLILYVIICSAAASCRNEPKKPGRDVVADNIDTAANPGTDFFQYAEGDWLKRTSIPASESGWGIGYIVQEEINKRLRKINEEAAKEKPAEGTIQQKIGDFWKSGMDSIGIDGLGTHPLEFEFESIDKIGTPDDLMKVAAELKKKGLHCLFGDYVGQDDKQSDKMTFKLDQGGLGMPNREYYFNTDKGSLKVTAAYKEYMHKTFSQLLSDSQQVNKAVADVFALETRLAGSSRKLADLRDPYKNYNKMSPLQLQKSCPINWNIYYSITGIANKIDSIIVGQPEFFTNLGKEINTTPIEIWKQYMKLRMMQSFAPYLDHTTFNNYFQYLKTLSGATVPRPRWKRVMGAEENAIGEALGQLFVKEYFSETAKKRYSDIVENIRAAYKERISKLPWMSDSTKQKALEKLAKITKKVGYPDKWKDFSSLKIDDGPWVLNVQRANEWWHNYDINKLGKPVDRTEWDMTPQTYNAYYNSSNNEIVLPAGIFVIPGFRDEEIDDAVVYGYAAASTVGHEITHGFDDQGRQYDAAGNLKNWWTKTDEEEFNRRAKAIIRQFNEFNPVDTLHINGEATQGENIADLGGILLGLDAFKKTDAFKKNEKIAGLTPLQRFFLGYTLSWQYQVRKERLANQILTDVHSPDKERTNGPLVNIPEFYEAFGIKQGDKMYRPDSLRVHIW